MSSIPYSGGTIYNNTFVGGTRAQIVTGLETALGTAGWSTISGAGTGDVLMKSAVTPASASNSIRMRLYDPGAGNCAQVTMKNDAGDKVSQIYYLLPAALKTFRVIACKYNFFIMTAGTSAAREFLCGGTLYIPTFLEGVIIGDLGWIQGNAISDTDATARSSFRTLLGAFINVSHRCSGLVNGSLVDLSNGANGIGNPALVLRYGANVGVLGGHNRWHDDSLHVSEAALSWGLTAVTDEGKVRGLIHNAMVINDAYAGDDVSISAYDGHAWYAITNNNAGIAASSAKGTLLIAIT